MSYRIRFIRHFALLFLAVISFSAAVADEDLKIIPSELVGHPEIWQLNTGRAVLDVTEGWKSTYDKKTHTKEYTRRITIPASWAGKRVILWVDDAMAVLEILIDGKAVGKYIHADHLSGSVDITDAVCRGREFTFVLRQLFEDHIKRLPKTGGTKKKLFTPASIHYGDHKDREPKLLGKIFLVAVNSPYIRAVRYQVDLDRKQITLNGQLVNPGPARTVTLRTELREIGVHREPKLAFQPSNDTVVSRSDSVKLELPENNRDIPFTLTMPFPPDAKLWQMKNPFLYLFKVNCTEDGKPVDSFVDRLGLRTFGIRGPNFTLNGKRFQPRKSFSGCDFIFDPAGWDPEQIHKHHTFQKYMNYNLYRTHGWPRSRYFFMLADQIGLPHICEAAMCFGDNYIFTETDSRFWDDYKTHVRRIIEQRGNSPSIFLWSAENELLQSSRVVDKTGKIHERLGEINALYKQLDPARPVMFEGDFDIRGQADIINEHYPVRYAEFLWPTDYYWVGKPHVPNQADGRFTYKTITWKRDKPYLFGETLWFPTGGPVRHTAFTGDKVYEFFIRNPWSSRWRVGDDFTSFDMISRAYNLQDVTGFVMTSSTDLRDDLKRKYNNPLAVFLKEEFRQYFGDEPLQRDYVVCNTLEDGRKLKLRAMIQLDGKTVSEKQIDIQIPAGERIFDHFELKTPTVNEKQNAQLVVELWCGDHLCDRGIQSLKIFPRERKYAFSPGTICVFDPAGRTQKVFDKLGAQTRSISRISAETLKNVDLLILGPETLSGKNKPDTTALREFVTNGGNIMVLAQKPDADVSFLDMPLKADIHPATMAHVPTQHPLLKLQGLEQGDFHWWLSDHFVARACYRKPGAGNTRCLLEVGDIAGLKYTPLLEIFRGKGIVLLNQLACVEKFDVAPVAGDLLAAATEYLLRHASCLGRLGIVASMETLPDTTKPVSSVVAAIAERLDRAGVKYTLLAGQDLTESNLRSFPALLLPPEEKALNVALNHYDAVTNWVFREGGSVIVHRMEPQFTNLVNKLICPNEVVFGQPKTGFRKPMYKIVRDDPLITGLSNETFWWIHSTKPTARVFPMKKPNIDFDAKQNPRSQFAGRWRAMTEPSGLARLNFGLGEFIFDQVCWDIRPNSFDKQMDYLRLLMTNCGVEVGEKPSSTLDFSTANIISLDIKPLCNMGFADDVPQDGRGGWLDLGSPLDVRTIPPGKKVCAGVPYIIIDPAANNGKSCIVLFGERGESFPKQVGPVAVNAKCRYLAFHHASGNAKSDDILGTYLIRYEDGKEFPVRVIEGENVLDWYYGPSILQNAAPAWNGKTLHGNDVATYSFLWKNPHPEVPIRDIVIHAGNPDMKIGEGALPTHGMLAVLSITAIP